MGKVSMQHAPLTGIDLQRQMLRLYGELVTRRESWAGKLVFIAGEGSSATGLPASGCIAGGTTLALDPDAATLKAVFRNGGIDFVVNTLDEALRVLKNEIRKQRPLGVGLIADIQPTLAEMAERGVLPDLQVSLTEAGSTPPAGSVAQAGMEQLPLVLRHGLVEPSERLTAWLSERGFSETVFKATTFSALRDLDARLLALLPADDALRRPWLQRIGRYQRPAAGATRIVWLTGAEQAAASPV